MRIAWLSLLIFFAGAGPSHADLKFTAPPGSPGNTAGMSCQEIIDRMDEQREFKITALGIYFHGTYDGESCVDIDYDRVFELVEELGENPKDNVYVDILKVRASTGNRRAARALDRLGVSY